MVQLSTSLSDHESILNWQSSNEHYPSSPIQLLTLHFVKVFFTFFFQDYKFTKLVAFNVGYSPCCVIPRICREQKSVMAFLKQSQTISMKQTQEKPISFSAIEALKKECVS